MLSNEIISVKYKNRQGQSPADLNLESQLFRPIEAVFKILILLLNDSDKLIYLT